MTKYISGKVSCAEQLLEKVGGGVEGGRETDRENIQKCIWQNEKKEV